MLKDPRLRGDAQAESRVIEKAAGTRAARA